MALTLSGTNGVVGAGFTVDASGVSVTAGVGTFGSLAAPAAGLTGALPAISAASLTQIPAANIVGVCTSGLTKTGGFGGTNTPAFSVYRNATQSITNNTYTKIQYNTENFDTDNTFDNSTNYRYTPAFSGKSFLRKTDILIVTHILKHIKYITDFKSLSESTFVEEYPFSSEAISSKGASSFIAM